MAKPSDPSSAKSQDQSQDKPQNKPQDQSQSGADSSKREALPFEPKGKPKSAPKAPKQSARPAASSPDKQPSRPSAANRSAAGIPEVVSQRMIRRAAIFCGVPTALAMSTFIVSYFVVSRDLLPLPTSAVLITSLGWFGLGAAGLTYGILSASWEETVSGSRLGWDEFQVNWGRMTQGMKEAKAASQAAKQSEQKKSEQKKSEQKKSEQKKSEQKKSEQKKSDRRSR